MPPVRKRPGHTETWQETHMVTKYTYDFRGCLEDKELIELEARFGHVLIHPGFTKALEQGPEVLMKIPGAWHSKSAVVSFFERWRCYERDNPTQFKAWENLVLDNLDEGYEFLTISDVLTGLDTPVWLKYHAFYEEEGTSACKPGVVKSKNGKKKGGISKKKGGISKKAGGISKKKGGISKKAGGSGKKSK